MIALDTNVLVRFLVRDDERQSRAVYARFKQAEDRREVFLIPLLVLLETLWVLDSAYRTSRNQILGALEDLKQMSILRFEQEQVVQQLLIEGKGSGTDLPDLLIALASRAAGCAGVLTLDKKAARSSLFQLLK